MLCGLGVVWCVVFGVLWWVVCEWSGVWLVEVSVWWSGGWSVPAAWWWSGGACVKLWVGIDVSLYVCLLVGM